MKRLLLAILGVCFLGCFAQGSKRKYTATTYGLSLAQSEPALYASDVDSNSFSTSVTA